MFEDLRHEEVLPYDEPYWSEGLALGLTGRAQYQYLTQMSSAKRTLKILRLMKYCENLLANVHGVSAKALAPGVPFATPPFLKSRWCRANLVHVPGGCIFNRVHLPTIQKLFRWTTDAFNSM